MPVTGSGIVAQQCRQEGEHMEDEHKLQAWKSEARANRDQGDSIFEGAEKIIVRTDGYEEALDEE